MDNRNERLNRLKTLVDSAGGAIENTAKLHSLAFLCQCAGTDLQQDFDFQYYRLYSPTLARDLDVAVEGGLLNQINDFGKIASVAGKTSKVAQGTGTGFGVIEKLAAEDCSTLEALSVICYLNKVGYSEDELPHKLDELKPELKNSFNRAFDLAQKCFSIKAKMLARS